MAKDIKLTKEQAEVIKGQGEIKRVIACAGSGKTWVITKGIIDILRKGCCSPAEVLALTFTRNAADNMRLRIRESITDTGSDQIDIYTFNSFGNQVIKENSLKLSLGKDFRVLSSAEAWQIIYDILADHEFNVLDIGKMAGRTVQDILTYIDSLKNNLITPGRLEDYIGNHIKYLKDYKSRALKNEEIQSIGLQRELCFIYRQYENLKEENNCIDYQDQVCLPYYLLRDSLQARDKYLKRYKYIFVDEFQDTNMAQAYLLALLNGRGMNMMVVGDDDQGIYAFRGACVENILNFHLWDNFSGSSVSDFYLTTNFRSGKNIIGVINNVISSNSNRFKKVLKPATGCPSSEALFFYRPSHEQESDHIVEIIKRLMNQGVRLKNIAVLYRRKRFDILARSLERDSIKYEIVGSKSFYFEKEILFIISWLNITHDLYDEISLLYLLRSEKYKICDRDLFFISRDFESGGPVRLMDGLKGSAKNPYLSQEARFRISEFINELSFYIKKSYNLRLKELVSLIYEHSGLRDELKSSFKASSKKRIKNIEMLIKLTNDFEENASESNLESFNTYLREVAKTDYEGGDNPELSGENSVKIMSIHASKGLEFDVVFIPLLWENDYLGRGDSRKYRIPAPLRKDNKIWRAKKDFTSNKNFKDGLKSLKMEEERRIFYVACSRAKKLLVLSHSQCKNSYDSDEDPKKKLVPFFKDALASNLKIEDKGSLEYLKSIDLDVCSKEASSKDFYGFLKERKIKAIPDIDWDKANKRLLAEASKISHLKEKPAPGILKQNQWHQNVFSLTSLLTYLQCPSLYKWTYIHSIPQKYSESLNTGNRIHSLIEKITKLSIFRQNLDCEDILKSIKDDKLKPIIKNYIESTFFKVPKNHDIHTEQLIYHKLDGFIVTSKIDRLDIVENKYIIADYKVSKKPKEENKNHIDQLKGYTMACMDAFGCKTGQIEAILFYLKDPSVLKFKFSAKAIKDFGNRLLLAIDKINSSQFLPKEDHACLYCSYKDFCRP